MSLWDNEKNVEMLKQLWADGLSATQIARRIPGATRSGICGKVHRLGLPSRTGKVRVSDGPASWGGKTARLKRKVAREHVRPKPGLPTLTPEELARYIRPMSEDVADGGLQERRKHQCCYPIGDPLKPGFGYCKNDREFGSYCVGHFLRMFPGAVVKVRDLKAKEKEKEKEAVS